MLGNAGESFHPEEMVHYGKCPREAFNCSVITGESVSPSGTGQRKGTPLTRQDQTQHSAGGNQGWSRRRVRDSDGGAASDVTGSGREPLESPSSFHWEQTLFFWEDF